MSRIYLPVLSAVLAMAKGNSPEAVEALQVATTGEMAMVGDGSAMLGNVHSPYIRGEALFRAGRVQEGIAEFQKTADHPGIRFTDPIGSLAHLQISRGYRLTGEIGRDASTRSYLSGGSMQIQIWRFARRLNANFLHYGSSSLDSNTFSSRKSGLRTRPEERKALLSSIESCISDGGRRNQPSSAPGMKWPDRIDPARSSGEQIAVVVISPRLPEIAYVRRS